MELGEVDEATGDMIEHVEGLDFGDFTEFFGQSEAALGASASPNDVVPSPSEALEPPESSTQRVDFPDGTNFNFSNLLSNAMRNTAASSFVLPWETDEWSWLFNPDSDIMDTLLPAFEPKLKAVKLSHVDDEPVAKGDSSGKTQTPGGKQIFQVAVSRRHDLMWTEKREAELQRALKKWYAIVCNWPDSWACKQEVLACDTSSEGLELLGDYLTGKSPATLVKRANSLIFMQNMLQQLGYFWPLSEPDFYRFLKTLKSAGHSTSSLKSLLEAVTFSRYSFHLPELHELTVSRRCLGAVVDELPGKVKQAEPLTVADVKRLHWVLEHGEVWDKVFSGSALFCIYSRARWSDFIHGSCLRLDTQTDGQIVYADMEVQIHKTMRASANRFKFLDLVVSGIGMAGHNWIEHWLEALRYLGMDPLNGVVGLSLMPAPGDDGQMLQRSLESDEASKWLRLLLGEEIRRKDSKRQISSHSLKATLLSMAAKRGLRHEDRLAMGHHIHPFRMADVYAREAQARCIRLIDRLLVEIKTGYFDPDASRAGRFHKEFLPDESEDLGAEHFSDDATVRHDVAVEVGKKLDEAEKVVLSPEQQLEEGHITSSSSESESESVELAAPMRVFYPPEAPEGFKFVQNKRTKTLHLVDHRYPSGTCCGRLLDSNYMTPTQLRYDSATCHVCKRHRM